MTTKQSESVVVTPEILDMRAGSYAADLSRNPPVVQETPNTGKSFSVEKSGKGYAVLDKCGFNRCMVEGQLSVLMDKEYAELIASMWNKT